MARLLKRKRVPILSDDGAGGIDYDRDAYVDMPVITEIDLVGSLGQEFRYRFRNDSETKLRTVNVKKVGHATGASFEGATVTLDQFARVERIKTIAFTNPLDIPEGNKAWQTDKKLNNADPPPKQYDGADEPRHLKVHYVRFYKDNDIDGSVWADSELIDQLSLLGTNAQEFVYRLRWPTAEQYAEMAGDEKFGQPVDDEDDPYKPIIGFCPANLALLAVELDVDSGDPLPTRMDPFQNICNVGSGDAVIFFVDLT